MTHYVFYSSVEADGEVEIPDGIVEFGIVTRSPAKSVVGGQVWFISGSGSPKQFHLCYTFIAEGVESLEGDGRGRRIYGTTGGVLEPPLPLNHLPWFGGLRKTQFWSLGLLPLSSDEIVTGLLAIAPEMSTLGGGDEYLPDLSEVQDRLGRDVAASMKLRPNERALRLASALRVPEAFEVVTTAYRRNPDVIVEVLRRAGDRCERCGNPAPFTRRSDGTPYLEVHHWTPLSEGGEDTVENAGALCPNCHRQVHHG